MSRRFVATDLHGCLRTFRYLVEEELRLRPTDYLYLLGDYVNKGPDSGGVLDYLMQLQDYWLSSVLPARQPRARVAGYDIQPRRRRHVAH